MGVQFEQDEPDPEPAFEVWDVNWPTVVLFLACETQWREVATMNGLDRRGLDYSAVDVTMRRLDAPDHTFNGVMIMERAALEAFGEMG